MNFPLGKEFASSSLLVVSTNDADEIVAACGIRSLLNILVLFVKENCRGHGIGAQLLRKTIETAERRRLGFITLSVSSDNIIASRLYCRFGFKEVMFLRKSHKTLMMLPLTSGWELTCAFIRVIGFLLPNTFLSYVHLWLYRRTL